MERITKFANQRTRKKTPSSNPLQLVTQFTINCWTSFLREVFIRINKRSLFLFIPVIVIVVVWHIPSIFDLSLIYLDVHILQHLSFVAVGVLVFLTTRFGFESYSILYLLSSMGMMLLSAIVLSITTSRIYDYYSLESHHLAGEYMIYFTLILGFIVFPYYIISKTINHIKK